MTQAEERALEAYPTLEQPVFDEMYPRLLFTRNTERSAFIKGYEQAERELGWHSVEESLPEIDEEVIVLSNEDGITHPCPLKICFAHIVDMENTIIIDGKPYKPESHNGWNIPGVKFWMPCPEIPNND